MATIALSQAVVIIQGGLLISQVIIFFIVPL